MHQAHSPQARPTRYTANIRNQQPNGARATTPAPLTQPSPKGGGGGGDRGTNNTTTTGGTGTRPHPITAHRLQRPHHRPNRKHHDTPTYPEPGRQGV